MKNKNYFSKSILAGSLIITSLAGFAQSHSKLQDDGKPVQLNPVVTGIDNVDATCDSLKTTFAAGNGQSGVMFNIVAKSGIYLTSFMASTTGTGADSAFVYYRAGSCIGHDASSTGWTLASKAQVTSTGASDTLILVNPTPLNYNMNSGDTVGIYITYTGVLGLAYTNGTSLDSTFAQKSSIAVLEGYGKTYPFGSSFSPREFNGIVNFCSGVAGVNKINAPISVELFPNPVTSTATFKIGDYLGFDNLKLVVTDLSGRTVMTEEHISSHTIRINKGNLSNGMYFYNILEDDKSISTGKFVIQ